MLDQRLELAAPDLFVLLHGPHGAGKRAFKLALIELLARDMLRCIGRSVPPGDDDDDEQFIFTPGMNKAPPQSTTLQGLFALFSQQRHKQFEEGVVGIGLTEFVARSLRSLRSFDAFVEHRVMSALVGRGLYVQKQTAATWVFPISRWELTAQGEDMQAKLHELISLATTDLPTWVRDEPAQAQLFLTRSGSATLLMRESFAELQQAAKLDATNPPGLDFTDLEATYAVISGIVDKSDNAD